MHGNIRDYAKVGIAHFMFWPDCLRRTSVMIESLPRALARKDIDVLDCCLPYDVQARKTLVPLFHQSTKQIGYAIHPIPLDKICLGATGDHEQDLIRLVMRDQLEAAASIGARTFTFATGADPGAQQRPAALNQFADFCRWLGRQLKKFGMTGLLEPFDRRGYRNFLLGPTRECVELFESLRPEMDNLRIQLDIAHLRLQGETLAEAVSTCGDLLGHVHLGNCVMQDQSDPFYGDKHPPIGYAGGEIDIPELVTTLRVLLECDYLNQQRRPALVIEAQPYPGMSAEQTIDDQLRRLERAWEQM